MSDDLHQTSSGKRLDVISWDEFFMSVAIAAQRRSKDPNTQVGACIANTNHRILSVGYNGTPSALNDDFFPWGTSDDPLQDKHNYVVHAEANAIISAARRDMIGGTLYLVGRDAASGELLHDTTSCAMCRRMIINSGITRVVNRIGDDGIEIIDVQNWIVNDESIQPKAEAE